MLIGTSGWQYRDWRGPFYPEKLAQGKWLEHYAERFQTVEVNNTFYRLPERTSFEAWAERTPADFSIVVKASRYITHIKRLRDTEEPVSRLMERIEPLTTPPRNKLGPILLQLPPDLKADHDSLSRTIEHFQNRVRLTIEFRHDSWFTGETEGLLKHYRAALCLADRGSRPISPIWRTADWTYLRLHEGSASPSPCYGKTALGGWAARLASLWAPDEDVFVFFNNDRNACAVRDAATFARLAREHGFVTGRVPEGHRALAETHP